MKKKYLITTVLMLLYIFGRTLITDAEAAKKNKYSDNKTSSERYQDYTPPPRAINLYPYIGIIYGNALFTDRVKDGFGASVGLSASLQVYGNFGILFDTMWSNFESEVNEDMFGNELSKSNMMTFTGGFYYDINEYRIDIIYGGIAAGAQAMLIFIPGVEYRKEISSRLSCFGKLSLLITNDWIVDESYEENYKSFMLSGGVSVVL